jgi:polyhydroxybutyrate depolymerase
MGKYLLLLLFSINGALAQGIDGRFKESEESMLVDNIKRTYIVHEPLPAIAQRSLVFILHGNGGSGALMKTITGFNEIADKNNAIVVYPDGYDQAWNDGRSTVRVKHIDDVKFFKTLTLQLIGKYNINPSKVYVAGLSNGAMMSLRLSCEASDTFKAVAAISATMPEDMLNRCPHAPVSRMMMAGNKDPIIPYDGGEIQSLGKRGQAGMVLGLSKSMEYFKKLENITSTPVITEENGLTKISYKFNHLDKNYLLTGITVNGGGHTWGSVIARLPENVVGGLPPNYTPASQIIWNFFNSTP